MSALDLAFPLDTDDTAWPAGLPSHLSATQIGMVQRCPEQWRRRYLLGEKEPPGAALIWGGADHYAHEQNFLQKIDSHEDIPVEDVKLAFAEGFDQRVEQAGGAGEVAWGDDKPGDVKDAGVRLVDLYHRTVSSAMQPTAVERKFEIEVPGVAVPVVGRVDVETTQPVAAVERKTSKQMVREVKPEWRVQGLLYHLVSQKPIAWHLSVKTKTPAVYTPTELPGLSLGVEDSMTQATVRMVQTTARTILAYWTVFGPDEPWPGAITHPWACGWCAFKGRCAWWGNS